MTTGAPALLGPTGLPVPADAIAAARRAGMGANLAGRMVPQAVPYDAASWSSADMGSWFPQIRSPDGEVNINRDRMVARTRDLARNDAWAKGAIGRVLDSTIGSNYRLISNPDYRALRLWDPAFDADWAQEFRQVAEARWRLYSADLGRYNDVERKWTVSQQFRLALGHKLVDGENLGLIYWLPERRGLGRASYATALKVTDPDRLSNPYGMPDDRYMRGGVEIDDDGVPLAYHVRRAHQNEVYAAVESMEWDRIAREDSDGFLRVIHDFDADRAEQHRGVSIFAPVIGRMKMLAQYYGVKLQQANLANIFRTFITSPFDHQLLQEALGEGDATGIQAYQDVRTAFHDEKKLTLNDVRIPTLAPGEDIKTVQGNPADNDFSPFTHEMLRSVAACLGVSAEQVTQDYSETNYSSARAAIVEAEKTYNRRCDDFDTNFATPFYAAWLQEAFEKGELPLPKNAPSYLEARTAYARCRWLGPARGWVDPVAERQGAVLGLQAGFSTLEQECAEQGLDWEENLEQRGREMQRCKDLGLPMPDWMGAKAGPNAEGSSLPPSKPS